MYNITWTDDEHACKVSFNFRPNERHMSSFAAKNLISLRLVKINCWFDPMP